MTKRHYKTLSYHEKSYICKRLFCKCSLKNDIKELNFLNEEYSNG